MKTSEEWYNAFFRNKSPNGDLEMIEQIQKEAWNEAIQAAIKRVYPFSDRQMDKVHASDIKNSITKLLKQ